MPGRTAPGDQVFILLPAGRWVQAFVAAPSAPGVTTTTRRFLPLLELRLPQAAAGLTGAPVVTSQGQFVGVICAQETEASGLLRHETPQASWFALTPSVAARVADGLSRPPYVVPHRWVGLQCDNAPNRSGAVIMKLTMGGPAHEAGLARGDIIVEAAGRPVHDAPDFGAVVFEQALGGIMPVIAIRNGLRIKAFVTVMTQPGAFF
jgi:S1-C subfamily serine protease